MLPPAFVWAKDNGPHKCPFRRPSRMVAGTVFFGNCGRASAERCAARRGNALAGNGGHSGGERCAARRGNVLAGNGGHPGGERCATRHENALAGNRVILAANDVPQVAGNVLAGNRRSALVVIWRDEFDGRCKEKIPRPAVLGSFCCDNDRREFPSIAVKPTALSADYLLSLPTETD